MSAPDPATAFAPGERLDFNQLHRPIDGLIRQLRDGQIDPNPSYQRGEVWGLERKQNLIRSLLIGLPIGAIFLNERGYKPDAPHYALIDGKQRLLTVNEWLGGEFTVPADWFEPDALKDEHGSQVSGLDLSVIGERRLVMNWTVATHETAFRWEDPSMLDREQLVFNLVNYGGVPQGESDLDTGTRG